MRILSGIAEIADLYEAFMVDLWGVVHDGVTPYPGALHCLQALRDRNKRIAFLSNAPRRAAVAIEGLRRLGVADALYDSVVTSGEMTHAALANRPDPWYAALGSRLYHLGPSRDRSVFEGLGLAETDDPAQASFVLNTGPDDEHSPADPAAFDPVLATCHSLGLPMLCANPDLTVVRDGVAIACAGALARRYASMGGNVRLIGKPDPAIYAATLAALGSTPSRTAVIGDSLHTDMAGAAHAGLDAVWVLGGIHAHQALPEAEAEAAALGVVPLAAIAAFTW